MGLPKPSKLPSLQRYTLADYVGWGGEQRWELLDGEAWAMAPAPRIAHQLTVSKIVYTLMDGLRHGHGEEPPPPCSCQVIASPIDVVLAPDTILQPDVIIVCDVAKLTNGKRVEGAPEVVIEVVSPPTAKRDRWVKRRRYARAGVPEYLLVDVAAGTVEIHRPPQAEDYPATEVYGHGDSFRLWALPQMEIAVNDWLTPPPPEEELPATMERI